ncbi:MAG: hypothetical protein RIF33_05915, partial [Cyclobacteriaceae bacterium]
MMKGVVKFSKLVRAIFLLSILMMTNQELLCQDRFFPGSIGKSSPNTKNTNHSDGTSESIGQDRFYPKSIGKSNPNTKNINHPDGTRLQDLKRATGFFATIKTIDPEVLGNKCSCTLMNNVSQDGTPYILTAEHCVREYEVGDILETYFTFDFEMANANDRGDPVADEAISKVWRVQFELLVKDSYSDMALFIFKDPNPGLLQNAYAAGWDNTVSQSTWSNISHPKSDHKKVYLNPAFSEMKFISRLTNNNGVLIRRKGYYYQYGNNWNGVELALQKSTSGSGHFSKANLLKAVESHGADNIDDYSSAMLNTWYSNLLSTNPVLSQYLDPTSSGINKVPGGYLNDLIPASTDDLTLVMSPDAVLATPTIVEDDPTQLHEDVVRINPSVLFGFFAANSTNDLDGFPIWLDMLGIKAESIGQSDLVLTVWYLDKDVTSGLYSERLIYGTYVNKDTPENTEGYGFTGQYWDCDNPPAGYLPCNRSQSVFMFPSSGSINSVKTRFLRAFEDMSHDLGRLVHIDTEVPVVIRLHNKGTDPAAVQALSYPAEMPVNALQFFNPEEVLSRFKSYKYPESRLNSEALNISSIKVSQGDYEKTISTGNNGGYLNLVNPVYKIGPIAPSLDDENTNSISVKINLNNPNEVNFSYRVWIDYFNKDVAGGRNDDLYSYDFVTDQPEIHEVELLEEGVNLTGTSISITRPLPTSPDILLSPDRRRMTRMRISVKEGAVPPVQFDQNGNGEVEDYLIEIVAPACEDIVPKGYADDYAEKVLPYCGEGGYREAKESLASHYQETEPGSLIFETGKQSNIQYATAKAVRKWYASTSDVVLEATTGIDYSVPRFLDNQVPNPAV